MTKLDSLRLAIDQIDKDLVRTLEERFKLVKEIGHYKKENGLAIHDPKREAYVLETKKALLKHPGDWQHYEKIFQLLMNIAKDMEK